MDPHRSLAVPDLAVDHVVEPKVVFGLVRQEIQNQMLGELKGGQPGPLLILFLPPVGALLS